MTTEVESRGAGMLAFSAILLVTMGFMRIFDAIWSFSYHGTVPDQLQNSLLGSRLSSYGWVWLVVGIALIAAGVGVLLHNQIARWFGVGAASIAGITAIWWIPYYPVWSLTYIYIAILVVYALIAHGERSAI